MKKILYTIVSLYLLIQAGLGLLGILGGSGNGAILLALSALSGYGAYWFGQKARAIFLAEEATKELEVPDTRPLDKH